MGSACTRDTSGEHLERFSYGMEPSVWQGGSPPEPEPLQRGPAPVLLNVYSVGQSAKLRLMNDVLWHFGTGAFHCGVEVYRSEWSYSDVATESGKVQRGTGIFACRPRQCEGHDYYESLSMGETQLHESEVKCLLKLLMSHWLVINYDTFRNNCCHFCKELCLRLGVGEIPGWVMNLAGAGAAVEAAGDTACCRSLAGQTATYNCCGPAKAAIKGGAPRPVSAPRPGSVEEIQVPTDDMRRSRGSPASRSRARPMGREGQALHEDADFNIVRTGRAARV